MRIYYVEKKLPEQPNTRYQLESGRRRVIGSLKVAGNRLFDNASSLVTTSREHTRVFFTSALDDPL